MPVSAATRSFERQNFPVERSRSHPPSMTPLPSFPLAFGEPIRRTHRPEKTSSPKMPSPQYLPLVTGEPVQQLHSYGSSPSPKITSLSYLSVAPGGPSRQDYSSSSTPSFHDMTLPQPRSGRHSSPEGMPLSSLPVLCEEPSGQHHFRSSSGSIPFPGMTMPLPTTTAAPPTDRRSYSNSSSGSTPSPEMTQQSFPTVFPFQPIAAGERSATAFPQQHTVHQNDLTSSPIHGSHGTHRTECSQTPLPFRPIAAGGSSATSFPQQYPIARNDSASMPDYSNQGARWIAQPSHQNSP
jgi:hypothetical protein